MSARGDGLMHPIPVAAIALLLLNDHLLKAQFHNALTGKLSDVVGMIFFPLLLQGLIEIGDRREPFVPRRSVLIGSAIATGVVFSAINLFEWAAQGYRVGLGFLQWPFRALMAFEAVPLRTVNHTLDPGDLIAVPFVAVAVVIGWRRSIG